MFRTIALSTTAAAALMATTALAEPVPVSEVRVEAGLTALDNAEAGRYWADIETDLANAIASRLADQTDEDGALVAIRVESVALADSFELITNGGEAYLEGRVTVSGPGLSEAYTLRISVPEPRVYVQGESEFVVLAADSDRHYRAMIDAFAAHVADRLG